MGAQRSEIRAILQEFPQRGIESRAVYFRRQLADRRVISETLGIHSNAVLDESPETFLNQEAERIGDSFLPCSRRNKSTPVRSKGSAKRGRKFNQVLGDVAAFDLI